MVQSVSPVVLHVLSSKRPVLYRLDLRQLGSTDKRVGLLQKPPPGTLVVIAAVVCLCVAVGGTEVLKTSKKFKEIQILVCLQKPHVEIT